MARKRSSADIARFAGGGVRLPSSDFNAVNNGLAIPYQVVELDLSTARSIAANTQTEMALEGNAVYIDQNTDVGVGTLILQGPARMAPPGRIYVQPGANFQIPFTRLILENLAQPGKIMRIFYGVDIDFKPGVSGVLAIGGVVSVSNLGCEYGSSFQANTAVIAGTPLNVLAAASNLNGVRIFDAETKSGNATGPSEATLIAKASAPASYLDADVILAAQRFSVDGANMRGVGQLQNPIVIPAGRRLDFMVQTNDTFSGVKRVLYTVL